jgi:hypothetical protein
VLVENMSMLFFLSRLVSCDISSGSVVGAGADDDDADARNPSLILLS